MSPKDNAGEDKAVANLPEPEIMPQQVSVLG